ncbi:HAD family hydrolase [Aeromicrobium sp. IC_218]|uniref:HAD family hydrolase n=1 Tax=Aeromicrobium sp. IC_218 TaxID=2545468 RepID=UPI001F60D91A|nr:HAD family hydrolase [Aeromicrobium sp. IC_218]
MTAFQPKLVALDVDGTIVDERNQLTAPVREAVRGLAARGLEVVISTGRAIPGVLDVVDKLGLDGRHAVASNGAVVLAHPPVDILHTVTFDASEAVRRVLAEMPDAIVAVEELGTGYRVSRPFPTGEINGTIVVEDVESLIADPVVRVIIRSPDHAPEEFGEIVRSLGLDDTSYYIGYDAWLDLAPQGVSKAYGLEVLCERLGVDRSEVLAVGDGNNDVEMLQWAGRGVAMGQAPDLLKDVADDVTGSIHEDGLLTELQRYL